MIEIQKPSIKLKDSSTDGTYGKFIIEPLEGGFGTTLGNSLRRVLLSSLPGVAVQSVKIEGVLHEFSTIKGIKEDVTEIILNLKSLTAKLNSEDLKTVTIDATGPCEVTAACIECDDEVQILNPELHIATLESDAQLSMSITLGKGRGYVSAEKNKETLKQNIIGLISTDSIYTPVLKVNFRVDNTRVGQRTDFDKLTLEVWTNGVISTIEAVSLSAKILTEHLNLFVDLSQESNNTEIMIEKSENTQDKLLDMKIEDLDFSVRAFNCLKRAGIDTLRDLIAKSEDEIKKVRNMGQKSLKEVVNKLDTLGLKLNSDDE